MKTDVIPLSGLYGKLPAYADFLHRRLPSKFVEPWNTWICQAIAQSRASLGDGWMGAYLTSPPWRFLLEPGIVTGQAWLGLVVSSVDQVNRCYPLTVAIALPEPMRLHTITSRTDASFDRLEALILHLIDGNTSVEAALLEIDAVAQGLAGGLAPASLLSRGGRERLMIGETPAGIAGLALRWRLEAGSGAREPQPLSAWWHKRWSDLEAASLVTEGLPDPSLFAGFLDGDWSERAFAERPGGRELR